MAEPRTWSLADCPAPPVRLRLPDPPASPRPRYPLRPGFLHHPSPAHCARIERAPYRRHIRGVLERAPRLTLLRQTVSDPVVDGDGDTVRGVVTGTGVRILEASR